MKLPVEMGNVVVSEEYKSTLKNLFSGCRVNFLLGAGFSANLLGTLSNNEVVLKHCKSIRRKTRMIEKR